MFKERTVLLIKPDGLRRGLVGEIISRFEKRGLKLVALKMVRPTLEHIDEHYPRDESWITRLGEKSLKTYREHNLNVKELLGFDGPSQIGQEVRKWLIEFMISAPIAAMVWEGPHAVSQVRKIVGPTIPSFAEVGTIRGDFSIDAPTAANLEKRPVHNLVHASETKEEAQKEIEHWFAPEEILEW
ncbi:nucleoside-diphosphate kinase [Candidatus Berkelbacteria bacterium]|nr:nucleoside-diphosphate kinase [Candidatus Berkelbacteria bacterium]